MMKNFDKNHFMKPRLFHIDIAYEVLENVNSFLFQLLCMSVIKNARDEIWRRSTNDLYLIEIMSMTQTNANFTNPNATTSNVANVNLTNLHSNDSSYIYVTCNGMVSWEIGKFIVFF